MRDTCGPDFHPNAMRDTKVPGTRLARCRQLDVVHSSFADRVESGFGRRPADSPDQVVKFRIVLTPPQNRHLMLEGRRAGGVK